ncbi:camphor resistance protein CrcB [Helicobacter sp. 12S02634-8]|uniref:fluoride efflux transporter CrcB n=1 Tax=Helicobacter sp. 12S02634-8 TaxID=1476199 RepID=UPI000BA5754B|nr:fluoride efflux transporter CrcB [Helicobacter sp. 12S02634-8]PAF48074.1 camphor resistance protein CrcB [Helicobacter sp. 12S02634-8]
MDFIWVGIGGAIGSVLRFGLGKLLPLKLWVWSFPLGTWSVNLIGSFLIGFVSLLLAHKLLGNDFRVFFVIGVLGGFTTFSSFGLDTFTLLLQKEYFKAIFYILSTNLLGLVLVGVGWGVAKVVLKPYFA